MSYEFFSKDDYVFHHGDKGTKFYIIIGGQVRVLVALPDEEGEEEVLTEVNVLG